MEYTQIELKRKGPVAWVTMNRPDTLNAITLNMWDELVDAFSTLTTDDDVRCIILTGAGRGFCAGRDQNEAAAMVDDQPLTKERMLEMHESLVPKMINAPQPIIAAVNGAAAGVGLSLALACDVRIGGADARFKVAFLERGLTPDGGLSYLLQRAVGYSKSVELCLSSEVIDATEALRIGLIDRLVPQSDLPTVVETIAAQFVAPSPDAVRATKSLLAKAPTAGLAGTLTSEAEWQSEIIQSKGYREGVRSFFEQQASRGT